MSGKYDASELLDRMRADLEARASSLQRVSEVAEQFESVMVEYASAYQAALADGWTRKDLEHLPTPPKSRVKNDE